MAELRHHVVVAAPAPRAIAALRELLRARGWEEVSAPTADAFGIEAWTTAVDACAFELTGWEEAEDALARDLSARCAAASACSWLNTAGEDESHRFFQDGKPAKKPSGALAGSTRR